VYDNGVLGYQTFSIARDFGEYTPTTVYPTTRYVITGSTFTTTLSYTPSTTLVTLSVPADFLPIEDTLPGVSKRGIQARAALPQAFCAQTTTLVKTATASSTLTSTKATTLSIIYNRSNPFDISFKPPGDDPIWNQPPRPPVTVTKTAPLTVTTDSSATATVYVNPACNIDSSNFAEYAPAPGSFFHLTAEQIIDASTIGSGYAQIDCCEAAYRLGGVAYWQISYVDNSCRVHRVAKDNTCSQAAHNFTLPTQDYAQPAPMATFSGNGACGRITDTIYAPAPK
jgi:hypothetical protein